MDHAVRILSLFLWDIYFYRFGAFIYKCLHDIQREESIVLPRDVWESLVGHRLTRLLPINNWNNPIEMARLAKGKTDWSSGRTSQQSSETSQRWGTTIIVHCWNFLRRDIVMKRNDSRFLSKTRFVGPKFALDTLRKVLPAKSMHILFGRNFDRRTNRRELIWVGQLPPALTACQEHLVLTQVWVCGAAALGIWWVPAHFYFWLLVTLEGEISHFISILFAAKPSGIKHQNVNLTFAEFADAAYFSAAIRKCGILFSSYLVSLQSNRGFFFKKWGGQYFFDCLYKAMLTRSRVERGVIPTYALLCRWSSWCTEASDQGGSRTGNPTL